MFLVSLYEEFSSHYDSRPQKMLFMMPLVNQLLSQVKVMSLAEEKVICSNPSHLGIIKIGKALSTDYT